MQISNMVNFKEVPNSGESSRYRIIEDSTVEIKDEISFMLSRIIDTFVSSVMAKNKVGIRNNSKGLKRILLKPDFLFLFWHNMGL